MKFNLIVPIAVDKPDYGDKIPYLFDSRIDGLSLVVKAITGFDLSKFDSIYFTILRKHQTLFNVKKIILDDCAKIGVDAKVKIVIFEKNTDNQPATVYETIKAENIEGHITIKDSDNYFHSSILAENAVGVFPLDALDWVNPQNKCYVQINDTYYLTNIIERKIIGRYFCVGAYFFEDASSYCSYYKRLLKHTKIHISNIIYLMILEGMNVRPIYVKDYSDWGTYKDFLLNSETK